MENKITVNEAASQFQMQTPDGVALIAYELDANTLVILHTEVPEAEEGKGIASDLAKFALDYARKNDLKVRNYCEFVQTYLQRHPEYQDLVIKS